MNPTVWAVAIATCLFFGTIGCLEIGYRFASRKVGPVELTHEGISTIEAAVFALLGLLLGFSFAGGTERLDARRSLIVEEANAIGTAYLRLDLLSDAHQSRLRPMFREYLDARLAVYQKLPDMQAAKQELIVVGEMQRKIWGEAVNSSRGDHTAPLLLLPAINEMIDVTAARTVALNTHLPFLIFALLIGVALLSALLAGYAMAKRQRRSWPHVVVYALAVAITVYTVADLDNPRSGWIRLDVADAALQQLRDSIR